MASLRHLVVVVPGIGGSVLRHGDEVVWGGGISDAVALLRAPDRLALTANNEVVADGLIASTAIIPGWTVFHGYERLMRQLANAFPDAMSRDAHVVAFGYDFRRSVREAAGELDRRVDQALDRWPRSARQRRVILVAHSMGGLVARYWLAINERWPCCLALITLGTPHRGAPKALDWLVNGVHVGPRWLRGTTRMLTGAERFRSTNETLRGWPSLYELLPRYPAVLDASDGSSLYPHELRVKNLDHKRATAAFALHRDIERAWATVPAASAGGPHVTAVVGLGHATPEKCVLADGRIRVGTEKAEHLWSDDWQGDGSVPGRAAWPIEFDDIPQAPTFVSERHGALAKSDQVPRLLRFYEEETKVPIRGEGWERPRIGLELEELYESETAVPLNALVQHAAAGPEAAVSCTLRRLESPRSVWRVRLERDGNEWSAELPAIDPGMYEVAIAARGFVPEPEGARERFGVVAL